MSKFIETLAWRIHHSEYIFFAFILNSQDLLKIAYASEHERERGAQRPLSEKRCKDVAKFIDTGNGIFANNLIINFPDDTKFIPSTDDDNSASAF